MLGNNIKRMRLIKNMTSQDLALITNVDEETIINIEKGILVPDAELLEKIALALNTRVGALRDDTTFISCDRTKRRKIFDIVTRTIAVICSLCACVIYFIPSVPVKLSIIFTSIAVLLLSLSALPVQAKKQVISNNKNRK